MIDEFDTDQDGESKSFFSFSAHAVVCRGVSGQPLQPNPDDMVLKLATTLHSAQL